MLLDFWWIKFFFYILVFKKLEWFKMKPVNKVAELSIWLKPPGPPPAPIFMRPGLPPRSIQPLPGTYLDYN